MKWREIGSYLRELWQRPAGPMNWKNPIRVFAVLGWLVVQGFVLLGWAGWRVFQGLMLLGWTVFRVVQFVLALPALLLFFFAGLWYAVWSFVRRPFPSLDENPILCAGLFPSPFGRSGWRGGGATSHPSPSSRRGRLIPNKRPRPSSSGRSITRSRAGAGDFQSLVAHHPGARTVYRRGDLRSRGIGENIGLHQTRLPASFSACAGRQAANPQMRAAALVLEVKGDFNYTWGGAAKEAQKPKAAKKPEAEPEPDDKTSRTPQPRATRPLPPFPRLPEGRPRSRSTYRRSLN